MLREETMLGFMERWPFAIRNHYMRHYQVGLQAIVNMPTKAPDERNRRMLAMAKLHRRVLRHVEKMHPDHFL